MTFSRALLLGSTVALAASVAALDPAIVTKLQAALQDVVDIKQKQYDCAFAIALTGPDGLKLSAAAGTLKSDAPGDEKPISVNDKFAWGSCTKMVTGVSILRLANAGVFDLDDFVAPILDPYFAKQNPPIPSMEKMFGKGANSVTLKQLGTMRAGVNDYDTAKPNETNPDMSTDSFRATCYKDPSKDWSPGELIQLPWVANGGMEFPPGTDQDYSSTNFILLGLVLAAKADVPWDQYDQTTFRTPGAVKAGLLNNTSWARHGAPSEYTNLHAYDRTSYNKQNSSALPGIDVSSVHGVFGGWTASDLVSPVQDVADLAYAIYGPPSESSLLPRENITFMTNWSSFYGFATFLLDGYTGQPTDGPGVDYGTCVGHLGATYGWNSMVQFTPGINMSISVATNVESDEQAQPSDAYCLAYNRVRQILLGEDIVDCNYDASGYFGDCVCPGNKYACVERHGFKECSLSYYANQSYADCSAECGPPHPAFMKKV